mmetsp:Transcript_7785/g.11043  ORF Transcript_7785/g.11043 Transcript_7785/m.11043 type:complete len:103 (-) Transcript_7785:864-1172(-)
MEHYMQVNTAIDQLLEVEAEKQQGVVSADSLAVGMARLGQPSQMIAFGSLAELRGLDFGAPLHCLALCASDINPVESEILENFRVRPEQLTGSEDRPRDQEA